MTKPYSPACDNNSEPIFAVIGPLLKEARAVLEIGSGTGQHAVHFAARLPHLEWYTSDVRENHDGIRMWLQEAQLANAMPPLLLDVREDEWPELNVDAVFSANTAHIMHYESVAAMFYGTGKLLRKGGLFLLYGPFNFNNHYTSDSNRRFDAMLRERDQGSGIRNFEDLDEIAVQSGLVFSEVYAMPANNHILSWVRK